MRIGSIIIGVVSIYLLFGCVRKEQAEHDVGPQAQATIFSNGSLPTLSPTPVQTEFSRNLALWDSLGITEYVMKVSMDAHGATRSKQTVFIEVHGDEINIRPEKKRDPRSLEYFGEVNTVPKLFAKIEQFERDGWLVRVEYDQEKGFPKSIGAGDPKSTAWWSYEVLEFVRK